MAKLSVAEREALLERLIRTLLGHAEMMQGRYKIVPANWGPLADSLTELLDEFVEDVKKDKPEDDTDEE